MELQHNIFSGASAAASLPAAPGDGQWPPRLLTEDQREEGGAAEITACYGEVTTGWRLGTLWSF